MLSVIGQALEANDGSYLCRVSQGGEHDALHVFAMLYGANVNTIPTAVIAAVLLSLPEHTKWRRAVRDFLVGIEGTGEAWDVWEFDILDKVLAETLRLYPVRVLTRLTTEDLEVEDFRVPQGSWFLLSPYWLHRSEEVFENPECFNPERWESERHVMELKSRGAYVSFGFGEHSCLGQKLARQDIPQGAFLQL